MGVLTLPLEDLPSVGRRIASADGPIAWSWAAMRSTSEWKLLAITVRGATAVADRHLEYEGLMLHTEQLSPDAAAERLLKGTTGPRGRGQEELALPPLPSQTYPYWMTTERAGRYYYLSRPEWPEFYFNNSFSSAGDLQVQMINLLNRKGLPFYPTVQAAFAEILYGLPPIDVQNFSPHLLVRLPDLRGRFGRVRFEDGSIQLAVDEGKPDGCNGCQVLATWRRSPGDAEWKRADVQIKAAQTATVETQEIPAEFWALLVDPAGGTLDRYGWSETLGQQPEMLGSLTARVARWLTEGEHQQLEYKQELGSKANRSFAETVAAFANGSGGIILIGVADDASVIGYGPPKVEDQVANIVREQVLEPATVEVEKVSFEEKPLYVVTVPAGDPALKPFRVGGRVMVRVLGTTREATTAEIRRLVSEAEQMTRDRSLQGVTGLRWRGLP